MLGNGDLVLLLRFGCRLGCRLGFGLVEKPELIGIGLLGAGAEPLVCGKPKLLLEPFDLQGLHADDGLERVDIIGQFRGCIGGIAHAENDS